MTIDPSPSSVCSISGTVVSFIGAGTCTIDANQAGDSTYNQAPQVQQKFIVRPPPPTITSPDQFGSGDFRRFSPRFQGENFGRNLAVVDKVKELAATLGVTASQLALAWVLAQGDDIVPIPGTKRRTYLEENLAALDVDLSTDDRAAIDAVAPQGVATGNRYPDEHMARVNV